MRPKIRLRGFRLGGRLARVCRWARRRLRSRCRPYLRLHPTSRPPPASPSLECDHLPDSEESTAMAARLAGWGRCLTRRLRPSTSSPAHPCREVSRCLLVERPHARQPQPREEEEEVTPKGHLPVYVGRKDVDPPRRVLVPVIYFNHPLFGELLRDSEEEFDFHHPGGITIPCPMADFESVRTRVAAASGVRCRHGSTPADARRCQLNES